MITRKQYPNHHVFETSIGGRPFTVETGKVAELADASSTAASSTARCARSSTTSCAMTSS